MAQVLLALLIIIRRRLFISWNDKLFISGCKNSELPEVKSENFAKHQQQYQPVQIKFIEFPYQMKSIAKRELFSRSLLCRLELHCIS